MQHLSLYATRITILIAVPVLLWYVSLDYCRHAATPFHVGAATAAQNHSSTCHCSVALPCELASPSALMAAELSPSAAAVPTPSAAAAVAPPPRAPPSNDAADAFFANHGKDLLSAWSLRASAHVCSGGTPIEVFHGADHSAPQSFLAPEKRSCVFRNLCWSGNEFVYYRDPAHPIPFEYSNTAGAVFAPPAPLLATGQKVAVSESREWLQLAVVDGPIPDAYVFADAAAAADAPVHILVTASYYDNIGHELADSVWPAFGTMLETRMLGLDNQVVLIGAPQVYYGAHETLSRRPVIHMGDVPAQTCFAWTIAGNGGRGLPSPPLPSLQSWSLMHDFAYGRYGWPRAAAGAAARLSSGSARRAQGEKLHIVVRYKPERHSFTNYDALMASLAAHYPSANITLLKPEELDFAAELQILSQASVYITPGGGGAFTAAYLPRNAVVIFAAACWPSAAEACAAPTPSGVCCFQVERHIWSNWQYLHAAYYNYVGAAGDMVRQEGGGFEPLKWNYPVAIDELLKMVQRGLYLSKGVEMAAAPSPL